MQGCGKTSAKLQNFYDILITFVKLIQDAPQIIRAIF